MCLKDSWNQLTKIRFLFRARWKDLSVIWVSADCAHLSLMEKTIVTSNKKIPYCPCWLSISRQTMKQTLQELLKLKWFSSQSVHYGEMVSIQSRTRSNKGIIWHIKCRQQKHCTCSVETLEVLHSILKGDFPGLRDFPAEVSYIWYTGEITFADEVRHNYNNNETSRSSIWF